MKKFLGILIAFVILGSQNIFARNHIILESYLGQNNYNNYYNYDYNRNYNNFVTYDNRYNEASFYPQNTNSPRQNYTNYNYYNYNYNNYFYDYNYNNYKNNYTNPYYLPVVTSQSKYPGCSRDDITIGGQVWASCNALDRRTASDSRSGWFYHGAMHSAYTSNNWLNTTLRTEDKNFTNIKSWIYGPCANGYRLPTRWEWETAQAYSRANNTTIAKLLNLPYNGGYMSYKDARNNISVDARLNIGGAYWTSTTYYDTPYVMHLGSTLANYRTDGTDMSNMSSEYRWQNTDNGLELVPGLYQEIANVRCIKNI